MDGDALVLTHFKNAEGEKVKDLPIAVPSLGELGRRCGRRWIGSIRSPWPSSVTCRSHRPPRLNRSMRRPGRRRSGAAAPDWATSAI